MAFLGFSKKGSKNDEDKAIRLAKKHDVKGLLKMLHPRARLSSIERKKAAAMLPALVNEYQNMRGMGLIRTISTKERQDIISSLREVAFHDLDKDVAHFAGIMLSESLGIPIDQYGQVIPQAPQVANCPYYSKGMCIAGEEKSHCSLQEGSYQTSCHVYAWKKGQIGL